MTASTTGANRFSPSKIKRLEPLAGDSSDAPDRNRRSDGRRDSGAATIFVVSFAVVLLVLAGLVVDGGLALNARQRVADDAEQAARAGSEHIDIATLRSKGLVEIDPAPAQTAAIAFLTARGYPAGGIRVDATAQQVTATATIQQKTALLSLIFINHFTVTAQGRARPAVGINAENAP